MPQQQQKIQARYLNLDTAFEKLLPNEVIFNKNYGFDINANAQLPTGTGNPSGEGQNEFTLTPQRSNKKIPKALKPKGFNKCIGTFECINTKELYYFNFNDKGNHGIYLIDENYTWTKIIIDSQLNFSDDPEAFISEHRVRIRVRYDENRNILEKHLIWTDGKEWQGWVNVIAAIKTDGFNTALFPYWQTRQPHFDRRELLQYPVRPPMIAPTFVPIANTSDDKGKPNWMLDTAIEFCIQYINTDGRETTVSPPSIPLIIKTEDFISNPDLITKKVLLTLYAGSALTEKINLYIRLSKKQQSTSTFESWTIWYLYDTIYRFTNCGDNSNEIIGTEYWKRTGQWGDTYDYVFNTFNYVFDNSLLGQIVDQSLFTLIENAMPQLSVGLTDLGDSILPANNRYGYDNFNCNVIDNLSAQIKEVDNTLCSITFRTVKLYAYAGYISASGVWLSQVNYFNGTDDTQFRTGGMTIDGGTGEITINADESKFFDLDFADKKAFQCYAKGTPYSSIGKLMIVNDNNTITEVPKDLDGSSDSDKAYISSVLTSNSYFVWQFEFVIPAGRYDFAMGRHNVATTADFRNTSTYVAGIANSLLKENVTAEGNVTALRPNSIVTFSKEMEIDCTVNDVDVFGNGHDMFYIVTPVKSTTGFEKYRFVEGYLREDRDTDIPMELFPYNLTKATLITGTYTDKNGHFFMYTRDAHANIADIIFTCKRNCSYPFSFTQHVNSAGSGFKPDNLVYFSDYNSGIIGFGNYIVLNVKVTDPTGTIGYSNIGVSIKDGTTDYTDSDGNARLIVHNGQNTSRQSNVYINAGGNFTITLESCGILPLNQFNESLVVCQTTEERIYPLPIVQQIIVQAGEQKSLKSNATYIVAGVGADLAGRRGYANKLIQLTNKSFPERDDVLPTIVSWLKTGALQLPDDIKWFAFYITAAANYKSYVQWVGDKIEYIDASGNATTNTASAAFVRITIDSLLESNINHNFTLLSTYQFVQGDKLRIFDNGEGQLLDTATYGDMIDVEVQGSNYNQAAINANLLTPTTNTVIDQNQIVGDNPTTIYVKYDSRFDKLKEVTGFWIELYTPSENNEKRPFFQVGSWMPVISGEPATFLGYGSTGNPLYDFPTSGDLNYWDTYFIQRNISVSGSGNRNFNHPFESPNITDTWGANITSAGQPNVVNPDAKQMWYPDSVIKSDNFISEGLKNGLGTFREENKKSFTGYWWGGIVAVKAINSLVFFLCENDYFTTDYNFHYTYPNAQGVMIVNLDNGLSQPHQKVGNVYGCNYEDTSSIIMFEEFISWHDQKNSCYVYSDYRTAKDITQIVEGERKIGIKSYYSKKSGFVAQWNKTHKNKDKIDIVSGLDMQNNNIYITFRPRRSNTHEPNSFINQKRNYQIDYQETFVYSIDIGRWVRTVGFAPEAYGKLRGVQGNEMFSFAEGLSFYHLNTLTDSFCKFYEQLTERVFMPVINENVEMEKILQIVSLDSNNMQMFVDLIYSDVVNSYSYIPLNYFKQKGRFFYAPVLKNANSFPLNNDTWRSMLLDGNNMRGTYFIIRFVGDTNELETYQELNQLFYKYFPILQTMQK